MHILIILAFLIKQKYSSKLMKSVKQLKREDKCFLLGHVCSDNIIIACHLLVTVFPAVVVNTFSSPQLQLELSPLEQRCCNCNACQSCSYVFYIRLFQLTYDFCGETSRRQSRLLGKRAHHRLIYTPKITNQSEASVWQPKEPIKTVKAPKWVVEARLLVICDIIRRRVRFSQLIGCGAAAWRGRGGWGPGLNRGSLQSAVVQQPV